MVRTKLKQRAAALICLGAAAMGAPALADTEDAKLFASDPQDVARFGFSTAIDGDTAIIGAHTDGADEGAAYVFEEVSSTWSEVEKLIGSDTGSGDLFGYSVDISGDLAIVGAPNHNGQRGAVYIFCRDTTQLEEWGQDAKLTVSSNDELPWWFGPAVAIDETAGRAVVGGSHELHAAYVFERDDTDCGASWTQTAKLEPTTGWIGSAVAISGNTIVLGAEFDGEKGYQAGAAYVFRYDPTTPGWDLEAKLTASDGAADDHFGRSVAIDGDTLVVGAEDGPGAEAAYVFDFDSGQEAWSETKILPAETTGDQFGRTVRIDGDLVIVGAPGRDENNINDVGAAYVYYRDEGDPDNWGQVNKLLASDGAENDRLGSVSLCGTRALVGAWLNDPDPYTDAGAAYVYEAIDQ